MHFIKIRAPNKTRLLNEVIYSTTVLEAYSETSKSWFKTQNVWPESFTITPLLLSTVWDEELKDRFQKITMQLWR